MQAQRPRVAIRDLEQNLSVYLRRAENGESLEVTDRGRSVAVLGPMPAADSLAERLIAEGRATRPTASWEDFVPPTGEVSTRLSDAIEALRADRP